MKAQRSHNAERQLAAHHEAGHVVAAAAIGAELLDARIDQEGGGIANLRVSRVPPERFATLAPGDVLHLVFHGLLVDLAGYAAEVEWCGGRFGLADLVRASAAGHELREALDRVALVIRAVRPKARHAEEDARAIGLWMSEHVRWFLRQPPVGAAGRRVAAELVAAGRVPGRKLNRLLGPLQGTAAPPESSGLARAIGERLYRGSNALRPGPGSYLSAT